MDDVKKAPCVELAERISITTTEQNDRRLVAVKPSALDFRISQNDLPESRETVNFSGFFLWS